MSSEQISEQTLPPEKKRCPHCGAIMPSTAPMCDSCLEKHAIQEGMPNARPKASLPMDGEGPAGNGPLWAIAAIVVVVVGAAVASNAPGVLCIGLFAVPAIFLYLAHRETQSAVAWLSMIGLVLLSGFIAFAVFCTPIFDTKPQSPPPVPEPREGEK